ncbi:hypothetical protein HZB00_04045 [Candidatus Woesearchaeota archaeon]|nr:hypothetical protein [Candidatus Woesearchaeota archaeon]
MKKRNGNVYEYAHLVHGIWKQRRLSVESGKRTFHSYKNSVHEYSRFMGRVYRFQDLYVELSFADLYGYSFSEFVQDHSLSAIYSRLIEHRLLCRGFIRKENVLQYGSLFVDLERLIVHDGERDTVLKLNPISGYLCSHTLIDLFQIQKIQTRLEGKSLLQKLRAAGITLTPVDFFVLADKLLREA